MRNRIKTTVIINGKSYTKNVYVVSKPKEAEKVEQKKFEIREKGIFYKCLKKF